jgi:biopolymer transport protein ExbB
MRAWRSNRIAAFTVPGLTALFLFAAGLLAPAAAIAQAAADTSSSTPALPSSALDSMAAATVGADTSAAPVEGDGGGFLYRVRNSYLGQMYARGGICMHPLLLCAIVGLVLIVERMWTLARARIDTRNLMLDVVRALRREGPAAALRACEGTHGPIAAILHSGLLRAHRGPEAVEKAIHTAGAIEMAFLERGLLALATISNVAPLLGFLGTVTGMISAFSAIAAAEQVSAKLVARGIEEALITTATGLMIAVPVSAFYAYFVLAIDRFVLEMEEASAELVDELLDLEFRRSSSQS